MANNPNELADAIRKVCVEGGVLPVRGDYNLSGTPVIIAGIPDGVSVMIAFADSTVVKGGGKDAVFHFRLGKGANLALLGLRLWRKDSGAGVVVDQEQDSRLIVEDAKIYECPQAGIVARGLNAVRGGSAIFNYVHVKGVYKDEYYRMSYGIDVADLDSAVIRDCECYGHKHGVAISGVGFGDVEVIGGRFVSSLDAGFAGIGIRAHGIPIRSVSIVGTRQTSGIEICGGKHISIVRNIGINRPMVGPSGGPGMSIPIQDGGVKSIDIEGNQVDHAYIGVSVRAASVPVDLDRISIANNVIKHNNLQPMPQAMQLYGTGAIRLSAKLLRMSGNQTIDYKAWCTVTKPYEFGHVNCAEPDQFCLKGMLVAKDIRDIVVV